MNISQRIGFFAGILVFLVTCILPSPFAELPVAGWRTAGLATMMAAWWITECVPIAVASLLPLVLAPLAGIVDIKTVSPAYAHPLIFLFMGGFMLSLAMERSRLHGRIARSVMLMVGTHPKLQVGGIMLVSAFLSMWMSNTATAVMMLPIVISIIALLREQMDVSKLAPAMLLGVAYACSIGGMATLIGTPPNALLAAYLDDTYGIAIGFGQWMAFGLPFSIVLLLFTWFWLTRKGLPDETGVDTRALFRRQLREMGPISKAEVRVLIVFLLAALFWIFRVPINHFTGLPLDDTGIAMAAAVLLFIIPSGNDSGEKLMDWGYTNRLPWGVLLLFGGGLALAKMIQDSGLADFIGTLFASGSDVGFIWVLVVVCAGIVFLTEVTSNTATAAGFLPLLGPIAVSMGESPTLLAIPAALAASCAFMMPVATPPNAIVYGASELRIQQMLKAGFMLNLFSIVLLILFARFVAPMIFS